MADASTRLTRQQASDAVTGLGWRLVLGELRTQVITGSLPLAAEVAGRAAAVAGADGHLRMDVRADRVLLSVQTEALAWVTPHDVELTRRISTVIDQEFRLATEPGPAGGRPEQDGDGGPAEADGAGDRAVQVVEIGIDALDIGRIRPFWKAVLGYADETVASGPLDGLVDPLGQAPAVWFQQMDAPRPQRNRIHFDVSVPHDQARQRIQAALAAGGTLVNDAEAPAFWVLADPEGNEACITTWQGRDG
jgi:4a-hydroxytetrahydrobiopterin dehydratase